MLPTLSETTVLSKEELLSRLDCNENGLSEQEVIIRQQRYGLNIIHNRDINILTLLLRQLTGNPLLIILATATLVSYVLGEKISSYYIFWMIFISIALGFWNEYSAEKTVEALLKKIAHFAVVIRNNQKQEITVPQLTIGDKVFLVSGSIIPADIRLIETKDLEVNESALTGESKSVYKHPVPLPHPASDPAMMSNIGFMGTSVENGSGIGIVVAIGKETEFGRIAKSASFVKPTTEFQKGLSKFGGLIIRVVIILTVSIFTVNTLLGHSLLESLLFALAIAVGLTPELLPVIVTISLSHGASKLARKHVVAKQLISIENLGNMDVLATDKTGTLTEGKIDVVNYVNSRGERDEEILELALLCNSAVVHHKVLGNSIDTALWEHAIKHKINPDIKYQKVDEEPFDYAKKAMFTVLSNDRKFIFIAKGAPETIIDSCDTEMNKKQLLRQYESFSAEGYRVIAIASKPVTEKKNYEWADMHTLTFRGFIIFLDTPKETAKESIERLHRLNVLVKVISGDNEVIAEKICREVGISTGKILLGAEIEKMTDEELKTRVNDTDIFARVIPHQKLRIIEALRANGHTVGFMGDGINDVPALHSADVGISVNTAIDVAKEAASVVLLRKSLRVLADGIIEGRRTFNNTMKYILMGTSSNFGNMVSAAGASFFLPFLPMTPVQILLTNSLYDLSQMSIPSDSVDHESLLKPRHWNIGFIKNYMIFFGPLSSLYDFLTFFVMLSFFKAQGALFQTGWFIESMATQILVIFIIRTARTPFFRSKPGFWVILTSLTMVGIAIVLPFTPLAKPLGFVTPPPYYFGILILLVITYLLLVETVKNLFLRRYSL